MTSPPVSLSQWIRIPAYITLLTTLFRLAGELMNWSPTFFSRDGGGGGALIGIAWLVPVFGAFFAVKLHATGDRPLFPTKSFAFVLLALATPMLAASVGPAPPAPEGILITCLASFVAIFIARPAWPSLARVLGLYGLAARIPVLLVMLVAMLGNWGTHYEAAPPGFPPLKPFVKWLLTGVLPQLTLWMGFTVVVGMFFGLVTIIFRGEAGWRMVRVRGRRRGRRALATDYSDQAQLRPEDVMLQEPHANRPLGGRVSLCLIGSLLTTLLTACAGSSDRAPFAGPSVQVLGPRYYFVEAAAGSSYLLATNGQQGGTRILGRLPAGHGVNLPFWSGSTLPEYFDNAGPFVSTSGPLFFWVDPEGEESGKPRELWYTDGAQSPALVQRIDYEQPVCLTSRAGVPQFCPDDRPHLFEGKGEPFGGKTAYAGSRAYFDVYSSTAGWQLWTSDGTPSGTRLVARTTRRLESAAIDLADRLFFLDAQEVFVTDGTESGTRSLHGTQAARVKIWRDRLALYTPFGELHISDMKEQWRAHPGPVDDIGATPGALFFLSSDFRPSTGGLRFVTELWAMDVAATASLLRAFPDRRVEARSARAFGHRFGFEVCPHGDGFCDYWTSDATGSGTLRLESIKVGLEGGGPVRAGAFTFFDRLAGDGVSTLWRTDGTPSGRATIGNGSAWLTRQVGSRYVFEETRFDPDRRLSVTVARWSTDGTASDLFRLPRLCPAEEWRDGVPAVC